MSVSGKYEFQSLASKMSTRSTEETVSAPSPVQMKPVERRLPEKIQHLENQVVESNQDLDVKASVKVVTRVQLAGVKISTDCFCNDK
ncbi:Oidioi.mRNA.OKI2018_I69.chr2.g5221.t1.cds [Oikopleura dioica]|uniref:Oidioi.mRNA.OKI2018_I69.chr2.g5221.t1.cds n=1 Tax=Oikopleura dioica TaxID=34765 RepID=A0ABN7T5C4_OIKDI|nr:Oidioi.mRNA.OKI2018_I69.chr2.g5221.t1.cds [Oikopleura dioica]